MKAGRWMEPVPSYHKGTLCSDCKDREAQVCDDDLALCFPCEDRHIERRYWRRRRDAEKAVDKAWEINRREWP